MFNQNGVFYNEEHKISFGNVSNATWSESYNTWTSWHLIPSSRPFIAQAAFQPRLIEIPGMDGMMDLTNYLTGTPNYGMRTGSWSFYIINHDGSLDLESLRTQIVTALHGKEWKIRLQDDPDYYYQGRLSVGNIEPGALCSSITISYQLDPYKRRISNNWSRSL